MDEVAGPFDARDQNRYTAFCDAVAECYRPVVHPDYVIELAAYNAGDRPYPPCERCAGPIKDGHLTGATECDECLA